MTLSNLPAPNFTGADLSVRVNAAVTELRAARRFATVAALLADATMAYGSDGRAVAPGDILEARGFRYQVAASGASDQHAATAGGVKLTVLPFGGAWHIAAFGTSTAAAQKAINVACATGGGEVVFPASCNYYGPLTVTTPTADGLGSSTLRLRLSGAGHGSHWTASGTGIMLDIGNDYTQSFCVDF